MARYDLETLDEAFAAAAERNHFAIRFLERIFGYFADEGAE